ncbi:MAG: hypothetical protein KAT68_06245 [Bacteroidales bacterium]|nr:hypothetical protein [Bacteroidales bacterium]
MIQFLSKLSINLTGLIRNNFLLFNLLFVIGLLAYQLLKKHFSPINEGNIIVKYNLLGIIFFIAGFIGYLVILTQNLKIRKYLNLIIIIISLIFSIVGYQLLKDPLQKWKGSDVAWNNYDAAKEILNHGFLYVIKSWNTRANPFDTVGYSPAAKKLSVEFIEKYNLKWISGDKWKIKDLPVDKENNRAYMHPPLTPIYLATWFKIFHVTNWSALYSMIFLNLIIISLLFYFFSKFKQAFYQFRLLYYLMRFLLNHC